jgi:hypothetical protein
MCQTAQSLKAEIDFVCLSEQPVAVLCNDVYFQPHTWRVYIYGLRM